MNTRNTQLPQDAMVLVEPARTNGEDAPPISTNAPADPRMEAPIVSESAPPASPDPASLPLPPPPALLDLPVATVLPPVASLLHTPSPLEDRIQRLEAELGQLRTAQASGAAPQAANARFQAASVARQPGRFWADLGQRLTAPSGPSAAPPRTEGLSSMVPPGVRRTWMLVDALNELRAIYWMFFDPRYRLSWTGRLTPLAVLGLLLTSYYWVPATSLPYGVGMVLNKAVDLVLAYVLYKLLSHESRRYRETAPDLPPSLRQ